MAAEVDKKTWVTFVDILRFVTPAAIGLLVFQVQNFESALNKNTEAVYAMRTDLALVVEKQKFVDDIIKDNKASIAALTSDENEDKREIQGIAMRLASVERIK